MISKYCYLTPVQTLFLKGFAILCIMSHNFFHWVPPVTYENEMHFYPMYFSRFLQDFTWPDAINCLFSFWGFYGVYLFIFLSGYGLTKSFTHHHTERNIRFIGRHIAKIYLLFLCSAALYLFIVPKVNYRAVLHVLSLTTNLSPETLFLVCGPWWFFSLIIQLYLLFLFLYKFIQKDISNIVLICFSYLLIALYWMKYCGTGIGLYSNAIGHIPEFSLGIFVAIYEKRLTFLVNKTFSAIVFLLSLIVLIIAQLSQYVFIFSFTASVALFLCGYRLIGQTTSHFLIFTGKLSPYLFGFNGFLYRGYFVKSARLGDSAVWDILYWLIWLGINYVFAYTAYKLCCFIHNLRRSS